MTSKKTDRRTFLRNALTGAAVAGAAGAVAAGAVAAPAGGDADILGDTDFSVIDQEAMAALETNQLDWTLTDDAWYPAFRQGQKLLLEAEDSIIESGFYLIEKNGVPTLAKASVGANEFGLHEVDLSWDLWDYHKESFGLGGAPKGSRVRAVVYPI